MIDLKKYAEATVVGYTGRLKFTTRNNHEFFLESRNDGYDMSSVLVQTRELDRNGWVITSWGRPREDWGDWHDDGVVATPEQWKGFSKFVEEDGGIAFNSSRLVERNYEGVSAFMSDLAHYCAIRVSNTPVGELSASAHKGGIAVAVEGTTVNSMSLREFRAWLGSIEARVQAAKQEQEEVQGTPVMDWLASVCDTGTIVIDVSQQVVPTSVRNISVSLSDWRYKTTEGDIDTRGQRELATAGDGIGKAIFNSNANERAMHNLAPVARSTGGQEDKLLIDVTRNFGWMRGMFGEGTSCWWNEYNDSRSILYHGGGYAVRLWDGEDNGNGRFWVAPTGNGNECVIFNAYGTWNLHQAAALLEHITGTPFRKCEIADCPSGMFINDSTHYAFDAASEDNEISIAKTMPSLYSSRKEPVWYVDTRGWRQSMLAYGKHYADYYTPPFSGEVYYEEENNREWCPYCDGYVAGPLSQHNEDEHNRPGQYWCVSCYDWHKGNAE